MPKTVLASKFQEWKGLDRISLVVHEMNCIFREITKDDYGLDGEIEVVVPKSNGKGFETTGGIIKVQAKSGSSYIKENKKDTFSTPVEKADLEDWHNVAYPVLFIVYHPEDDKLYFKEIKKYVKETSDVFKAPFKVVFNKAYDEFSKDAYTSVTSSCEISPARISTQQREKLYTNLLLVKRQPRFIYSAKTVFKTHKELRQAVKGFLPPFTIREGVLSTFENLYHDRSILGEYCSTKKVIQDPLANWVSATPSRAVDYVFMLNQLLGSYLHRLGLKYQKAYARHYFPRRDDSGTIFREDWFNIRTSRQAPSRIVAKQYRYGKFQFWRHLAASLRFNAVGDTLFLQIIPKYFFTNDGEIPCSKELAGPYTTRIKAMEHNNQVLNHILFWSDFLSNRKPSIELSLHHKALVVVEKLPFAGIAGFSIPDDPAVFDETEEQPTLLWADDLSANGSEDEDNEYYI